MNKKISFILPPDYAEGATHGIMVGDFNNWNIAEGVYLEKLEDGSMTAELLLTEGKTYEYRYLLNDKIWVNDNNGKKVVEAFGQAIENCVIEVPFSKKSSKKSSPKTKEIMTKKNTAAKTKADNLTKISGITEEVVSALNNDGIITFKDLGSCTIKRILLNIENAGLLNKVKHHTTWSRQAKLAAAGKWDELKIFKQEMISPK